MANLVIDIGNTQTKVALFTSNILVKVNHYDSFTTEHLNAYLKQNNITHSILASVKPTGVDKIEAILKKNTNYTRFSTQLPSAINNQYKSMHTLGSDRLAGVIGANSLYPNTNCLVIDLGTCITYDAIDYTGLYRGGSISLGIQMRLKALHNYTAQLPLVDLDLEFSALEGTDTQTSILSGVIQGTLLEVKGFIKHYSLHYDSLKIVFCGGDAFFFDSRLKNTIFAHPILVEPHLVLIGLNETIHQQND